MTIKTYLILALLIGGFFIGGYIIHRLQRADELEAQNAILKASNKEIKHEAQSFADRPRTNADIVNSLCKLGRDKLKREGGSKQSIPVLCR